ncbi:MAG: hypothetical protein LUH36_08135 [Oscillospiraceae bacterium]|nr:hypothetical protein [Oscillospiraceae bacterium]
MCSGGLNENLSARDGEIQAMENMTSDYYPLLAPRPQRCLTGTLTEPKALAAGDCLCWVDGTDFYYDSQVKGTVSPEGDKRLILMNDWVIIWPDKLYYNAATEEFGSLEAAVSSAGARFCSLAAPGGISTEANCLVLEGAELDGVFRPGDGVVISGCTVHGENDQTLVVREVAGSALYFYDDSFTLDTQLCYTVGEAGLSAGDYNVLWEEEYYTFTLPVKMSQGDCLYYRGAYDMSAVIAGAETALTVSYGAFGDDTVTFTEEAWLDYDEPGTILVTRPAPDLEYLCQCNNRLWGVTGQEIYCSALGDPRVWYNFDGTADGCWSVEAGSGGPFTGAFAYGGYPLLFKENHIYRVYGSKPSAFQLLDTETLGCEAGSDRSFAVVGQTLYYRSPAGFAAYAGGVPALIDRPLGPARRADAVAGTDGRKYYVSCRQGEDWSLYVYDAQLDLWHREDDTQALDFAWCAGELYFLAADGSLWQTGRIRTQNGTPEDEVGSECEFADFYSGGVERQGVNRLYFRVQVEGTLSMYVSYDGGDWQPEGTVSSAPRSIRTLHLIPRRCDSFRVKLTATGPWKLWGMSKEAYTGSTR